MMNISVAEPAADDVWWEEKMVDSLAGRVVMLRRHVVHFDRVRQVASRLAAEEDRTGSHRDSSLHADGVAESTDRQVEEIFVQIVERRRRRFERKMTLPQKPFAFETSQRES